MKNMNKNNGDIFSNEVFKHAFKSMSQEERDKFQKFGHHMYGKIDYKQSSVLNNLLPPIKDCIEYVDVGLRSGLLPKDLNEGETRVMEKEYGSDWYKKYGFTKDDLIK